MKFEMFRTESTDYGNNDHFYDTDITLKTHLFGILLTFLAISRKSENKMTLFPSFSLPYERDIKTINSVENRERWSSDYDD